MGGQGAELPFIDPESEEDAISQYKKWKENAQKEDSPCATVFLLGDMKVLTLSVQFDSLRSQNE